MISTRNKMFADLLGKISSVEVPAMSLAHLIGLDPAQAIIAFVASLGPAVPALVDFVAQREEARRRNGLTYLIGVSDP